MKDFVRINSAQGCAHCGKLIELTRDHVIPQWFLKRLKLFGFNKAQRHRLRKGNYQLLCFKCNTKKGGEIEWSHPKCQELKQEMLKVLDKI